MPLPTIRSDEADPAAPTDSVLLVVYAPFGEDEVLSTYPDGASTELTEHPLYKAIVEVAAQGVHVAALIDRVQQETVLVEIKGGKPESAVTTSLWKEDMTSPYTLAGLLRKAHASHPTAAVVLAMEGHGAGYLPEIDRRQLTQQNVTHSGSQTLSWNISPPQSASPVLPMGSPVLPMGSPVLPMGSPVLPVANMPLSTWGLAHALQMAQDHGVPKLAVIHFNNCFNMSVELLHTVYPHAEFATGYSNYNFFTSGQSYPGIFKRLRLHGPVTAQVLAQWFAEANHQVLAAKGHHPTTGGVVALSRMKDIAERVDDLADALLAELTTATPAARAAVVESLKTAITRAQHFDTGNDDFILEVPDQLTDLMSLAAELQAPGLAFNLPTTVPAAKALQDALAGIRQYGDDERPWVVPDGSGIVWDFSSTNLAMNILLPDPILTGLWDWRSPYYLAVDAESDRPLVQPHVIDFLKVTDWVDFIKEYHREVKFTGLQAAMIPPFPVFNPHYEPKRPPPPPPGCDRPYVPKKR